MRLLRELAVAVALLVTVGVLARSGVDRFVPLVADPAVAMAFVTLLTTQSACPRTAVGPQTRIIKLAAQSANVVCVEYGSPATARWCYVHGWVALGVPTVLFDDGENPVYDAHRD